MSNDNNEIEEMNIKEQFKLDNNEIQAIINSIE